ncbi:MAG: zinc ribbon domain-containing protein [Raoultibacter sp.]
MKCTNCNQENSKEALFCNKCGASITRGETVVNISKQTFAKTVIDPYVTETSIEGRAASQQGTSAPEGFRDFARYQQQLNVKAAELREAKKIACVAEAEYRHFKDRWTYCSFLSLLFGLGGGYAVVNLLTGQNVSGGSSVFMVLVAGFSAAILAASFPFGFMPLKDFISNHGAFLVFSVAFIVFFSALVMVFCVLAGLPYVLFLRSKIKTSRKTLALAQRRVQVLDNEFATF